MNRDMRAEARAHLRGSKLYHERARRALSILVRQAQTARGEITCHNLARELGMPNPRNLNYVLGCIGETLQKLSDAWGGDGISAIQCLVVNKHTRLPGAGIGWFLAGSAESYPSARRDRLALVAEHREKIRGVEVVESIKVPMQPTAAPPCLEVE